MNVSHRCTWLPGLESYIDENRTVLHGCYVCLCLSRAERAVWWHVKKKQRRRQGSSSSPQFTDVAAADGDWLTMIGWILVLIYIADPDWPILGAHLLLSDADWLQSSSHLHDWLWLAILLPWVRPQDFFCGGQIHRRRTMNYMNNRGAFFSSKKLTPFLSRRHCQNTDRNY